MFSAGDLLASTYFKVAVALLGRRLTEAVQVQASLSVNTEINHPKSESFLLGACLLPMSSLSFRLSVLPVESVPHRPRT